MRKDENMEALQEAQEVREEQELHLVGSLKQVAWAHRIRDELTQQYGGILPVIPFASWWIDHRQDSYEALWASSESLDNTLALSPFSIQYPRYTRDDAQATLRILASTDYFVIDTETTGIGKSHEVTEIAIVGRDARTLLHSRVRPDEAALSTYAKSKAAEITKISADALQDAPPFAVSDSATSFLRSLVSCERATT